MKRTPPVRHGRGRRFGWTLIAKLSFEGRKGTVRADGTFRDDFQTMARFKG